MLYDFDVKFNPDFFDHLSDYENDDVDKMGERDSYSNVNNGTLEIPTPPLSPTTSEAKSWLPDDVADALLSDATNSGGFQKSQNVDFLDDYDFVKLLEKTADYAEYLVEMQSFVKAEMRDKNCLWSLQCANWKNGDCRHCKRCKEAEDSPTFPSGVEWSPNMSTPSSGLASEIWPSLIEVADSAVEVEEKVTTLSYPMCDHSYHIKAPTPTPTPIPKKEHLGLDTPSATSDSETETEIDVVSITPAAYHKHIQKTRNSNIVRPKPESDRLVSSSDAVTKSNKNSSNCKGSTRRTKFAVPQTKHTSIVRSAARCRDGKDADRPLTLTFKRVYPEVKSENGVKRTKREKSARCKAVVKYTTKNNTKSCNRSKSGSRSGNRADLSPEERERRTEHNDMEKKRRGELVNAFGVLKKLLNLNCEGRSSRATILRNTRECNLKLIAKEAALLETKAIEIKRNQQLTARLNELQKKQRQIRRPVFSRKATSSARK